jgi:hypothetical protein
MAWDFHSRCDNKAPTITLFKIKDGDCIGGYTAAKWYSSPGGEWVNDTNAFLFNLSKERQFFNRKTGRELYSFKESGPLFGDTELRTSTQPFDCDECVGSAAL